MITLSRERSPTDPSRISRVVGDHYSGRPSTSGRDQRQNPYGASRGITQVSSVGSYRLRCCTWGLPIRSGCRRGCVRGHQRGCETEARGPAVQAIEAVLPFKYTGVGKTVGPLAAP